MELETLCTEVLLADELRTAAEHDTDYNVRNPAIYHALALATQLGYPAGIRLDPTEPDWPVAYIDLPTGQVSWHLPAYPGTWDGHDTPTKLARCRAYGDV